MNVYKLSKEYEDLFSNPLYIDIETGELTEAGVNAFEDHQGRKEDKAESIARFIRNLDNGQNAYENEINRITALKKRNDRKILSLKKLLCTLLKEEALKTDIFSFSFTKSESLEILDKDKLPSRFTGTKTVETVDSLTDIKKDLKKEIELRIQEAINDNREYSDQDIKTDVYSENGINITFKKNLQIK